MKNNRGITEGRNVPATPKQNRDPRNKPLSKPKIAYPSRRRSAYGRKFSWSDFGGFVYVLLVMGLGSTLLLYNEWWLNPVTAPFCLVLVVIFCIHAAKKNRERETTGKPDELFIPMILAWDLFWNGIPRLLRPLVSVLTFTFIMGLYFAVLTRVLAMLLVG